jgi:outer membrane protein TolC
VEQAHLDVLKSQEQVAGLELGLQTNAESSVLNLREAQQRIEAQGRTVQQAERGYRIAQTRYQSGAGTLLELNDGLLALSRAKLNRLQALYDYLVASADVDQTIGRIPEQLRIAEHND